MDYEQTKNSDSDGSAKGTKEDKVNKDTGVTKNIKDNKIVEQTTAPPIA